LDHRSRDVNVLANDLPRNTMLSQEGEKNYARCVLGTPAENPGLTAEEINLPWYTNTVRSPKGDKQRERGGIHAGGAPATNGRGGKTTREIRHRTLKGPDKVTGKGGKKLTGQREKAGELAVL